MVALLFDCDGVLADTERDGHLFAFNQMFTEYGVPVQWSVEEYGAKLKVGGGKERMLSLFTPAFIKQADLPEDPTAQRELVGRWHRRKTEIFAELVRAGRINARPGVQRIAGAAADQGWQLAVASTSAEESVRAVLERTVGPQLAARFEIFAGDLVRWKKPAPDIYLYALQRLGVGSHEAVVIEDSRNGLLSSIGAGVRCLITPSTYTHEEDMSEAELVVSDLGEPEGAPVRVLSNKTALLVNDFVTLDNVQACLDRRSGLLRGRR
jgi:HAD superfamily hydrolase (TIGR01509 family)